MTRIRCFAIVVLLPVSLAMLSDAASGAPVVFGGAPVAQDTTFKPDGSYTIDVAVGGQAMTMALVVEKKADGTYSGVFKHVELGEIPTTNFKVEGRKLSMGIVTPGGPGTVTLTVNKENVVEGEWAMEGDGSKISGKKAN